MKRCFYFLLALTLFLALYSVSPASGEETQEGKKGAATPMQEEEGACKCTPISKMILSPEQVEAIDRISLKYNNLFMQLRSQIMLKQLEVAALLRNPDAGDKDILSAASDIGKVRSELEMAGIQCQMEIRRVLTAEQIRSWCNLETPPLRRVW